MQDNLKPTVHEERSYFKPYVSIDILEDDEIPYEFRMKYIIKEYRKDQEKWAKLFFHAKNLEEKLSDSTKTIKSLREQISSFEIERKHYKEFKNQSSVL